MKYALLWIIPIALMALITPLTPGWDLAVSHYFYDATNNVFASHPWLDFLYDYGEYPAMAVGLGAMVVYLLSFVIPSWKKARSSALILFLTLVIGAGLIVNGLFKENWGRPRPRQITEFGGEAAYLPYYQPNLGYSEHQKSFPCGHCTMGFYFFCVALLGYQWKSKFWTVLGLFLALTLGVGLSIARIAQGGHYLSDVLIAALIMWLTALTMVWIIEPEPSSR